MSVGPVLRLGAKNAVEISARRASKRKNLLGYQEEGWFVGSQELTAVIHVASTVLYYDIYLV
jgi:hypothetical protein